MIVKLNTLPYNVQCQSYGKLNLIIGRRSLNQHNLCVLTQTKRMGSDPSQIQASIDAGEVGHPYGDGLDRSVDSQTDDACRRHSEVE